MGITGASQNSYTMDQSTRLHDNAAITVTAANAAGLVDTAASVIDLGDAYYSGKFVVEVISVDRTSADEEYEIILQLADDDEDFSAATTVVTKAGFHVGEEKGLNGTAQTATQGVGRNVIGFDNEVRGALFRFARVVTVLAGTSPVLVYHAFLVPDKG